MKTEYDLAVQLRNCGFPQAPIFSKEPHGYYIEGNIESDESGIITTNSVYIPTLEEVIEELGVGLHNLQRVENSTDWIAIHGEEIIDIGDGETTSNTVYELGSTPKIACINLYLALHKKQ